MLRDALQKKKRDNIITVFMHMNIHWRKYAVEFLATGILMFVTLMALASGLPGILIAVFAGLTVCIFFYTMSHVSGTHMNPAVTLGMLMMNKISWQDAVGYIVAQVVGVAGAIALATATITNPIIDMLKQVGASSPMTLHVGIAEALGGVILAFGFSTVMHNRAPENTRGFVVGASFFLGILISIMFGSMGIVNPATALALSYFNPMYILGPIIGVGIGFGIYKLIEGK